MLAIAQEHSLVELSLVGKLLLRRKSQSVEITVGREDTADVARNPLELASLTMCPWERSKTRSNSEKVECRCEITTKVDRLR